MSQKLTKLSPKNTMLNYFKPSPNAKPSTPKTPKVMVADEKEEEVKTSIKKSVFGKRINNKLINKIKL